MKTFLKAVFLIATMSIGNAQALCMNPDGSLDDLSLRYRAPVEMLPMCSAQVEPVKVTTAVAVATSLTTNESIGVPIPYIYGAEPE